MHIRAVNILRSLKDIDAAKTSQQALDAFLDFAQPLGLTKYLIVQVVNPDHEHADKAMMHSNWPAELIERRVLNSDMLHDPVVQYGLRSRFAFNWEEAYTHASRYGKTLVGEASEHNIKAGYSIPMRRPGAPIGGFSIGADKFDLSPDEKGELELAAMHTYTKLESLHPPFPQSDLKPLSPQEIDVLQFATVGKTAWETSVILGISEAGVRDALKRARAKLDAVNTLHACSKAIANDFILP